MGKCARNWMVRDKFIAAHQSCGLRRHLNNVPPDTPIRDIVDHCHVWESQSKQNMGSAPGAGPDQDLPGMSVDSREPGFSRSNSLKPLGCAEVDSRIPVPVASVIQSDVVARRKKGGGGGGSQIAPLEIISSLIARLLRTAQEDHPAEVKVPLDAGARPPSIMPEVGSAGQNQFV